MSEHEKDTAFLRRCILYDDSAQHHQLEEAIHQAQRDERCVWRAVLLMALLTALGAAGLYSFLGDSPPNIAEIITPFGVKVLCALVVASLICMLAFAGLGMVYREKLAPARGMPPIGRQAFRVASGQVQHDACAWNCQRTGTDREPQQSCRVGDRK